MAKRLTPYQRELDEGKEIMELDPDGEQNAWLLNELLIYLRNIYARFGLCVERIFRKKVHPTGMRFPRISVDGASPEWQKELRSVCWITGWWGAINDPAAVPHYGYFSGNPVAYGKVQFKACLRMCWHDPERAWLAVFLYIESYDEGSKGESTKILLRVRNRIEDRQVFTTLDVVEDVPPV